VKLGDDATKRSQRLNTKTGPGFTKGPSETPERRNNKARRTIGGGGRKKRPSEKDRQKKKKSTPFTPGLWAADGAFKGAEKQERLEKRARLSKSGCSKRPNSISTRNGIFVERKKAEKKNITEKTNETRRRRDIPRGIQKLRKSILN